MRASSQFAVDRRGRVARRAGRRRPRFTDTDDVPYGVFLSSLEGKFLKVNDGLVRMLGYRTAEELLAVDVPREIYFDPGERARLVAAAPIRNNALEVVWKRRDGSPVPVQISGRWLFDENRKRVFIKGVVWDLTELKRSHNLLRVQRDVCRGPCRRERSDGEHWISYSARRCGSRGSIRGGIYLVDSATGQYRLALARGLSDDFAAAVSRYEPGDPPVRFCNRGMPSYAHIDEFEPAAADACRPKGLRCWPFCRSSATAG